MTLLPTQPFPHIPSHRAEELRLRELLRAAQELCERSPRQGLIAALRAIREAQRLCTVNELAWALHLGATCACRLGRYLTGQRFAQASAPLFDQLGNLSGTANVHNLLGVIAHETGELAAAYGYLNVALSAARPLEDRSLTTAVLGNLAQTAQGLGDYEAALRWTLEAQTLVTEMGESAQPMRARLLLNSVSLSLSLGQFDEAADQAQTAAELVEDLQLSHLRSEVALALSQVAEERGDLPQAISFATGALQAVEGAGEAPYLKGDLREVVKARLQLGRVLLRGEHLKEAESILHAATEGARQCRSVELEAAATTQYALSQMARGHWPLARHMLTHAIQIAHAQGYSNELASALLILADLEEQDGRPREALEAFKEYHDLDRALFGERQARLTQALLVTHEVDRHRKLSSALEAANRELVYAANHDALTGALNRRAFMTELEAQVREIPQGFALVLFDLDHFKQVNDVYGHPAGDAVLTRIVQIGTQTLREGDLLCRWGGEEFAALLPAATLEGARAVCERLREAVRQHPWHEISETLHVTASFGLSEWSTAEDSIEKLLSRADAALYLAKNTGRNRVMVSAVECPFTN